MRLNKQKRIGEIVIIMEGKNPEFDIIKHVFCDILGYSVSALPRKSKLIQTFEGHDPHSRVILFNTPSNNVNSLENVEEFAQYMHEMSIEFNIDFVNDSTYIVFDRDHKNNRKGTVQKLLKEYNSSQGDNTDGQNGLLLINYPSVESFVMSLFEDDTHKHNSCELGTQNKALLSAKNYEIKNANDNSLLHATKEFLSYLKDNNLITQNHEVYDNKDLGLQICETQQNHFDKFHAYCCMSQAIQILIDLDIIQL